MMADGFPYAPSKDPNAEFADKVRAGMRIAACLVAEELKLSGTGCDAVALEQCHADVSGIVYVTIVVEKPGSEPVARRLFRLGINDAHPEPSVVAVTPADAARLEGCLEPLDLRPADPTGCMM